MPLRGGARGVLVPSGHRPGPTEAAAETRPLEKLYIILKIEIPLPYQQATLAHSFLLREGGERAPVALCREPTEPAGETQPPSLREMPPQAAEGVQIS